MSLPTDLSTIDHHLGVARAAINEASHAMLRIDVLKTPVDTAALVIDLRGEREVLVRLLNECHKLLCELVQNEECAESRHHMHRLREQIEDAVSRIYSPVEKRLRDAQALSLVAKSQP